MGEACISLCLFPLCIQSWVSAHFSWHLVSPGSSCIKNLHLSVAMLAVASKAPVIKMTVLCLMLYERMKIQPLPQIAYNVLAPRNSYPCSKQFSSHFIPGMDACKMNIIWRQWIILPRPPNVCLLLITLVHCASMGRQNEWSGFRSLCTPAPLFPTHYSVT